MPAQAIVSAAADDPLSVLWTWRHHVAPVAAGHCTHHQHTLTPAELIGGVACRSCWERAIFDDRALAEDCGLPLDIDPDPSYVDEIAVRIVLNGTLTRNLPPADRARCARVRASLTEAERHEVRRRLGEYRDRRNLRHSFTCPRATRTTGGTR